MSEEHAEVLHEAITSWRLSQRLAACAAHRVSLAHRSAGRDLPSELRALVQEWREEAISASADERNDAMRLAHVASASW